MSKMRECAYCGGPIKDKYHKLAKYCSRECFAKNKTKERVTKYCPCGNKMSVPTYLADRKKYCSKSCMYKYCIMPKGENRKRYTIKVQNKGWKKKGEASWNKGTIGLQIAWNKGIKGTHFGPSTEFTTERTIENKNTNWKGNIVGYSALHGWAKRRLVKPDKCPICNQKKKLDLSNKSGQYLRDLNDWEYLCHKCHIIKDRQIGLWGTRESSLIKFDRGGNLCVWP